jgi:hypothetical protein
MTILKKNFAIISIIILGCFTINLNPSFSPSDDVVFKSTIMAGLPFFGFSEASISQGRFNPVGGLIFNLILISPRENYFFYLVAFEFAIFSFLIYSIVLNILKNKMQTIFVVLFFLLSPASTMVWTRLSLGERDLIFFISIFIYFYLSKIKNVVRHPVLIVFSSLAIYTKEPIGILFITLSILNIKFDNSSNKGDKLINILIIASSLIYYLLYFHLTTNNDGISYGSNFYESIFISSFRNLFNYVLFSDSFIFFICIPIFFIRLHDLIKNRFSNYSIYDSFLFAGLTYCAEYLALNIYQPYYLTPSYIFLIPAICFYFKNTKLIKHISLKYLIILFLFLYSINILTTGIHYLTRQLYLPKNFKSTITALTIEIKKNNDIGIKPTIFIDGRYLNYGLGEYHLFEIFLKDNGLSSNNYDMASNLGAKPNINPETIDWPRDQFQIYHQSAPVKVGRNDLLILTSEDDRNPSLSIDKLKSENFVEIFRTESPLFFPQFNLKSLIKYFLIKHLDPSSLSKIVKSENIDNSPDFYIFKLNEK